MALAGNCHNVRLWPWQVVLEIVKTHKNLVPNVPTHGSRCQSPWIQRLNVHESSALSVQLCDNHEAIRWRQGMAQQLWLPPIPKASTASIELIFICRLAHLVISMHQAVNRSDQNLIVCFSGM